MVLELKPYEIQAEHGGLEIRVLGFQGDITSEVPSQVFIEVHEGKLKVYVWDGSREDPAVKVEIDHAEETCTVCDKSFDECKCPPSDFNEG